MSSIREVETQKLNIENEQETIFQEPTPEDFPFLKKEFKTGSAVNFSQDKCE